MTALSKADKAAIKARVAEIRMRAILSDPILRINTLYKIIVKDDDEEGEGKVIQFRTNAAQNKFIQNLHHRNIILKARQLGFTTLIAILWLDHALFNANVRCGIQAQDLGAAETIFRDKVKFAYDNLPTQLRLAMPLKQDRASELMFAHNGSSMRVATSMRSGTIHRLHVSEFGKICAKFPEKAREVITGSIPAVPLTGITVIESTAEGRDGHFYSMSMRSLGHQQQAKKLTARDYRMHFFPWFDEPSYRMDPDTVLVTEKDHEYFNEVERVAGRSIDAWQRAWYVATREADLSVEDMWQEYPSFPEEAFQVSSEGVYYASQIAEARKAGRIIKSIPVSNEPCFTCWDIGSGDGTAIWVIQPLRNDLHVIYFYEAWGESYAHAARWLMGLNLIYHTHILPHDADHVRQGKDENRSPKEILEELMIGHRFEVVPRIGNVNWGIDETRSIFHRLHFDETNCKDGLVHLENYKKKWNSRQARWDDEPSKAGGHSEAADALRQFAQREARRREAPEPYVRRGSNWRTA